MSHCREYLPRQAISIYRQNVEWRLNEAAPLEKRNRELFHQCVELEKELSRLRLDNQLCHLGKDASEHVRKVFGINEDGSLV